MKKDFRQSKIYQNYLKDLAELEKGTPPPPLSNEGQLLYCWSWGETIYKLNEAAPRGEGKNIMKEVGAKFGKKLRLLFDLQKFYQTFPQGLRQIPHPERLTWSHVKAVLPLESEAERLFYLKQAAEEQTPVRRIETAVRKGLYEMTRQKMSRSHPYGKLERNTSPTYNYQAQVLEVLDGDTLQLVAEQGFYSQHRLTLRLRGINCAEMHGLEARRAEVAKDFILNSLKDLEFILIKTYKADSFGRYIADVFYHPLWKDHLKIFQKGYFLNQQLLDEGLAKLAVY